VVPPATDSARGDATVAAATIAHTVQRARRRHRVASVRSEIPRPRSNPTGHWTLDTAGVLTFLDPSLDRSDEDHHRGTRIQRNSQAKQCAGRQSILTGGARNRKPIGPDMRTPRPPSTPHHSGLHSSVTARSSPPQPPPPQPYLTPLPVLVLPPPASHGTGEGGAVVSYLISRYIRHYTRPTGQPAPCTHAHTQASSSTPT
jgi:hypothetical protein